MLEGYEFEKQRKSLKLLKLSLLNTMDMPMGWSITAKGKYMCMCYQFKTEDLTEVSSHMSTEFEGYCVRGLKCLAEDKFQCICGKQFFERNQGKSTVFQAFEHVYDQMNGIEKKCVNLYKNKCQKCNLQLDSPSALKIHLLTKSHLNFESKLELYCKVCDIHYRGQKEMLTHMKTAKHMKRVQTNKL